MAVTLDDVARVSGVSRATASRALSGGAAVSPSTRRRVQAVAESLDYRANHSAQSLARGRTNIIGFILPVDTPLAYPFHSMLLTAITASANRRGKGLMLWCSDLEASIDGLRQIADDAVVDGILVVGSVFGVPWVDRLLDGDVPVVAVGSDPGEHVRHRVGVDDYRGGRLAAEHLLDQGHTRLATITGPVDKTYTRDRLAGFLDAAAAKGVVVPDDCVLPGGLTLEDGVRAMTELLPQKPTAVFVANDMMANGAYSALYAADVAIPDDISIVAFDDLPQSAYLTPPLTTVRQDAAVLADLAVDLLLKVVDDPDVSPDRTLATVELVERNSTGPVSVA